MIDLQSIDLTTYRVCLKKRGGDLQLLDNVLEKSQQRKKWITNVESQKAERNRVSKDIANKKQVGQDVSNMILEMKALGERIKKAEAELTHIETSLKLQMASLPNICHESVPTGTSEADNQIERHVGDLPQFAFPIRDHITLGTQFLKILDFEKAAKISGARFVVLYGWGARLERALSQFMLDIQTKEHGYIETLPPYLVKEESLWNTGQFPKFTDEVFHINDKDLYPIPTAEVPITNYYAKDIINSDDLPLAFVALTPCFRSEAGSYGKDVKGLIRQHQFHKVELVRITHPEDSLAQLELMTSHAEEILQRLKLPYRVISLCMGDLGFAALKTYDLEVWLPGQNTYREISSVSNCGDFQARRAGIRLRSKSDQKLQFVHTLNGSGLAVGRTLMAILENYQQEDGSVTIPQALQPYMDGMKYIPLP